MLFFLKKESDRVRKLLAAPEDGPDADEAEFLLLPLPASRVERVRPIRRRRDDPEREYGPQNEKRRAADAPSALPRHLGLVPALHRASFREPASARVFREFRVRVSRRLHSSQEAAED